MMGKHWQCIMAHLCGLQRLDKIFPLTKEGITSRDKDVNTFRTMVVAS